MKSRYNVPYDTKTEVIQTSRSTNPEAYAALVSQTFLFQRIPETEIASLLAGKGIHVLHYEKEQVIFDREQNEQALAIILYGSCVVTKETGDTKMPMSILRQCDLFGAASLFHRQDRYVARVTAAESAWILLIPEEALRNMMKKDFRITENYLSYLTARIRFLSERLDGFLPQTVEERVLNHIRKHAKNGLYRSEWSVSALAEALCISRTTLYRAMDKLVSDGKIERHGRAFRLPEGDKE